MIGRWSSLVTLLAAVIVATSCGPRHPAGNGPSTSVAAFTSGRWVFTVDRVWSRITPDNFQYPFELPEADYAPTSGGRSYTVDVWNGGITASVNATPPIVVVRMTSSADRVAYDMICAVPCNGGRFVVWSGAGALQGELTLYGSGVPIVWSERGTLVREP